MLDMPQARARMVEQQLAGRDIVDPFVLDAMGQVPREAFLPDALRDRAYDDTAQPLDEGQTVSQPYIVAAMIQDYKFGVVVGEPTADVPSTYGAAHQFNLPNTKLAVLYPKALILRPSGELASSGVQPDHEVIDDVFTAQDEILEKALQLARR